MKTPKYKITEKHLETQCGIAKLERDGFSREQISKSMYAHTPGCKQSERNDIMRKLFDRSEK